MTNVTRILSAIEQGDGQATDQLLLVVYNELRQLAAQLLSNERPGQTLQATALVHEAYLRLVGPGNESWENRRHFFGAAAEAMRRVLVETARRKGRLRHGGNRQRVNLGHAQPAVEDHSSDDLIVLDEALTKLAQEAPEKAQLLKLRYFAGLSEEQAAGTLGISRATASRHWTYACAWLRREMIEPPGQ